MHFIMLGSWCYLLTTFFSYWCNYYFADCLSQHVRAVWFLLNVFAIKTVYFAVIKWLNQKESVKGDKINYCLKHRDSMEKPYSQVKLDISAIALISVGFYRLMVEIVSSRHKKETASVVICIVSVLENLIYHFLFECLLVFKI